jgi:tetratricopeptide (TPR) repeat protein
VSKANVIWWLTILVSVAMGPTSSAAPPEEELARAERLYMTGDFIAAARIAESVPSVRGQTLAARAMLAHAAYVAPPAERLGRYREAARLARTAIDYDAGKAEAYRYLVIALGHVARDRSLLVAHFEGYADEGRRLIDRALTLEPDSPWGHAVLGAWHTEVVAEAGAALAEYLYDASAERAKVAFETAIRLEPDNPVLRFEYAQAVVRLGGPGSAAAARNQLAAVVEMTPRDAVETIVTSRARRALEEGSAEAGEKAPGGNISNTGDEHP